MTIVVVPDEGSRSDVGNADNHSGGASGGPCAQAHAGLIAGAVEGPAWLGADGEAGQREGPDLDGDVVERVAAVVTHVPGALGGGGVEGKFTGGHAEVHGVTALIEHDDARRVDDLEATGTSVQRRQVGGPQQHRPVQDGVARLVQGSVGGDVDAGGRVQGQRGGGGGGAGAGRDGGGEVVVAIGQVEGQREGNGAAGPLTTRLAWLDDDGHVGVAALEGDDEVVVVERRVKDVHLTVQGVEQPTTDGHRARLAALEAIDHDVDAHGDLPVGAAVDVDAIAQPGPQAVVRRVHQHAHDHRHQRHHCHHPSVSRHGAP